MDVTAMRIITYKGILIGLVVAFCLLKDRPRRYNKREPEEKPPYSYGLGSLRPLKFYRNNQEFKGEGYVVYGNNLEEIAKWCSGEVKLDTKAGPDPRVKVRTKDGIRVARPGDAVILLETEDAFIVARNDEWYAL